MRREIYNYTEADADAALYQNSKQLIGLNP